MKSNIKLIVMSAVATIFIGCGSSSSSSANVSKSDLKGTWVQQCELNQDTGTSEQDIITFKDDNKLVMRNVEYDNETCNNVASELIFDYSVNFSYVLGDNFDTAKGQKTTKIDMTVTGFNVVKGQVNIPSNIVGQKEYTIVYIENDKLYGGVDNNEHNSTSDATRPVAVDFTQPSIKK